MNAPFYFIDIGRRRIIYCDSPDAEPFAGSERAVTFKSVVPVLRFDASGSKVSVIDCSAFVTATILPD